MTVGPQLVMVITVVLKTVDVNNEGLLEAGGALLGGVLKAGTDDGTDVGRTAELLTGVDVITTVVADDGVEITTLLVGELGTTELLEGAGGLLGGLGRDDGTTTLLVAGGEVGGTGGEELGITTLLVGGLVDEVAGGVEADEQSKPTL